MLFVNSQLSSQAFLTALYEPGTPVGTLIQPALERIQQAAKPAKIDDYDFKARRWNAASPKMVLGIANAQELLTSITDLIDRYTIGFDVIPPDEQDLIDRLRTDFSSRTLHEILHRFLVGNDYDFSSAKSPLIHSEQGVLQLLLRSAATQKLFDAERENPVALMANQLEPGAIRRNEMMRLLISLKNVQRVNKRQEILNCNQININELDLYLTHAIGIFKQGLCPTRLQLQIVNEVHYTGLDLEFSFEGAKAAILDAALDEKRMAIVELLKKFSFTRIFLTDEDEEEGSIQKDDCSCSFYSLYHLQKSSKRGTFFADLEILPHVLSDDGIVRKILWKDFPKEFLTDAQAEPLNDSTQNQRIIQRINKYANKIQEFIPVVSKQELLRIMTTPYNNLLQ